MNTDGHRYRGEERPSEENRNIPNGDRRRYARLGSLEVSVLIRVHPWLNCMHSVFPPAIPPAT